MNQKSYDADQQKRDTKVNGVKAKEAVEKSTTSFKNIIAKLRMQTSAILIEQDLDPFGLLSRTIQFLCFYHLSFEKQHQSYITHDC